MFQTGRGVVDESDNHKPEERGGGGGVGVGDET